MSRLLLAGAVVVAAATFAGAAAQETGLKPGDVAPAFSLEGSDGRIYSLSDYRGVRPVVLAWFPKSFAKG